VSRETVRWNNRGHYMVLVNHSKCAIVRRNYKGLSMVIVHHASRRLRRANTTMCGVGRPCHTNCEWEQYDTG
jgi:hypothetical protein